MLYGLLVFVFQYGSRRAANREITRPLFKQNLRALFPELDSLPHADTLFRLLCRIDVSQIEQAHIELVNRLIRNKKFTCSAGDALLLSGARSALGVLLTCKNHWLALLTTWQNGFCGGGHIFAFPDPFVRRH